MCICYVDVCRLFQFVIIWTVSVTFVWIIHHLSIFKANAVNVKLMQDIKQIFFMNCALG